MTNSPDIFLGIDGGGTKCKARLEDAQGNLLSEAKSGPANAYRNLKGSVSSIIEAAEEAVEKAKIKGLSLKNIHAGIGLAGINIPQVKQAFLGQPLPFASYHVTTDLHIACLGAHQQQDGAIVIIGTGSSGLAVRGEQQLEVGGHGFIVGDKGSGAWLGRKAISLSLETLDGFKAANELSAALLKSLQCETAYDLVYLTLDAKPAFYATIAPLVFELAESGQADALELVQQAGIYISKICQRLVSMSPTRLSLIGGLTDPLIPYLDATIQEILATPKASPEQGAILFAQMQLSKITG